VAIVGASADVSRTAGKPLRYLQKHGFTGTTYVVNPRYTDIDGVPCFPSVADLPEAPDVGLVLLGGGGAISALRDLATRGAPSAIVLAGGFAEIDADGLARQQQLREAAGGMRLLGPNTIGMVNVADRTALSASIALELDALPDGKVALVSQSGGMLGALLSRGAAHGLGFSRMVATGNEADVDVSDVIEYLLDDPETSVIALYLESVRRPARFREVTAQAEARGKSLVVYKVGRSEAGAASATSHTGALAGEDRLYDALFLQTGVVRVNALTELVDVACALVTSKRLRGSRLGVLTSTGGAGAVVADACGVYGFSVPPPDDAAAERLSAALPAASPAETHRNPVDLTLANLRAEAYRDTISALVESPTYDGVVVVVGSSGLGDPRLAAEPVREAAARTDKPVMVYVSPHALNIVSSLNSLGVPAFHTAEGCAAALVALRTRTQRMESSASVVRSAHAAPDTSGRLNEAEALALFESFGIPAVRHAVARTPEEAEAFARDVDGPVVLKVLSRDIAHKSDVGGVRLNVRADDVARVCAELARSVGRDTEGWLIQEQVAGDATEMLLGVIRDPQLGLALLLGAGGTATEVFEDTSVRLLPLREEDPEDMLAELKSSVLLKGFRGRPAGDVVALFDAMRGFASMAEAFGDRLLEAEINPLFVLPAGRGVRAADALAVLGARPDSAN
jgi:acyl-CoA synthetase (NDP forming)